MTETKRFRVHLHRSDGEATVDVLSLDADRAVRVAVRHLQEQPRGGSDPAVMGMRWQGYEQVRWVGVTVLQIAETAQPLCRALGDREDFGMRMHTALRKWCDSKASSLVWSMIEDPAYERLGIWRGYLDRAWEVLCKLESLDRAEMAHCLRRAVEGLDDPWGVMDEGFRPARQFVMALELLSNEDWVGMTYGLIFDDKLLGDGSVGQ